MIAGMRTTASAARRAVSTVERYAIYDEFASGGMATVHLARLDGAHGFRRSVAVKRLRRHLSLDREFGLMLVDEARISARVRHHNVVSTLDVLRTEDELLLVMEYVHGESLMKLARRCQQKGRAIPVEVACAIMADVLHGLHAAHEAKGQRGQPLEIVHRDVSPQNILVGADGVTQIADFGIAKAAGNATVTSANVIKGKLSYMSPEQIAGRSVHRGSDVFAASIVLWELLAGERLFHETGHEQTVYKVLSAPLLRPSTRRAQIPPVLDAIVMRGLERDPQRRFASAAEMALSLEAALPIARPAQVAQWVESVAGRLLAERAQLLLEIERADDRDTHAPSSDHISGLRVLSEPAPDPHDVASASERSGTRLVARGTPVTAASVPRAEPLGWLDAVVLGASLLVGALAVASWLWLRDAQVSLRPLHLPPPLPAVEPLPQQAPVEAAPVEPAASERVLRKARPAAKRPVRSDPCDPPYTVDAAGDKLFKAACL